MSAADEWDPSCAYGCHDWAYNRPYAGMKSCTGTCGGVYMMIHAERMAYPAPDEPEPEPATTVAQPSTNFALPDAVVMNRADRRAAQRRKGRTR